MKNGLRRCRATSFILQVLLAVLVGGWFPPVRLRADSYLLDPQPALTWKEMLDCQLVVLARAKKLEKGTLTLEVVRTLKGRQAIGSALAVKLEHWYAVSAHKDDGATKEKPVLVYRPESKVPWHQWPFHEPALYFFKKAENSTLRSSNQVQAAYLTDGWAAALAGKPLPLWFRIVHPFDRVASEDAVEELYETRDREALDRLLDWVRENPLPFSSYPQGYAKQILEDVGDKNGDVADHAWNAFKEPNTDKVARTWLAVLFGRFAPTRAKTEFYEALTKGPNDWKTPIELAYHWLGEEVLEDLAFALFKKPETFEQGLVAIRPLLLPSYVGLHDLGLGTSGEKKLLKWMNEGRFTDAQMNRLTKMLEEILPSPPMIVWDKTRKILLNPDDEGYQGKQGGQADQLLNEIRRAHDSKAVPLLIEVYSKVPSARKNGALRYVLPHYARLCPNAFMREWHKQGESFPPAPRSGYGGILEEICYELPRPQTPFQANRLWALGYKDIYRNKDIPWKVVLDLKDDLLLGSQVSYVLDQLLRLDLAEGREVLHAHLDKKAYDVFPLAVKHGYRNLLPEVQRDKNSKWLLEAGDAVSLKAYGAWLKNNRQLFDDRTQGKVLSEKFVFGVADLFPRYPEQFVEALESLLESKLYPERKAGEELLQKSFGWNFGFRAGDFAKLRAAKLKELRPKLAKIARLSLFERQVAILSDRGFALEGEPGPHWEPSLLRAALSTDYHLTQNALDVYGLVTIGKRIARYIHWNEPPRTRYLQIRLLIQDSLEAKGKAVDLSDKQLQSCWADLAGDDRRRAYDATGKLIQAEDKAVRLLQTRLKPVEKMDRAMAAKLLADLDSGQFAVREAATRAWKEIGPSAEPVLREAMQKGKLSLEASQRIKALMAHYTGFGPECRRMLRVLDVLENVKTPEADKMLESLSRGLSGAWLTHEAEQTLSRRRLRAMGGEPF